jgi:NADH:ubiquinone reductase (H+-translocating)
MKSKKKVVVVGGGFAGIQLVRNLDKRLFEVLLVDSINHHQFQPLFYQVATSQLEPASISFPLRNIFRGAKNVQIRLTRVFSVNPQLKIVYTSIGDFEYDYLILAIGCKTNFFGNDNIQKHSFTLKSTYDAIKVRNHILLTFEKIISAKDSEKEALLNLVIVGAGPTGVELAGAFAEIRTHILPKDYPRIDMSMFSITLIEGTRHTLNGMSKTAREVSREYLLKMGVNLITETFVADYDGEILLLSNSETIRSKTVIWAAGVTGNRIEGLPVETFSSGNRLKVDRINRVMGCHSIYAIGDIALMITPKFPRGHPQLANVAINQAKNLANNMRKLEMDKKTRDYEYRNLGTMATIGRNKAVVDFPIARIRGYLAWLIWMFLHLMLILSVRNKLVIFVNWAWIYITRNTSLRLILTPEKNNEAG